MQVCAGVWTCPLGAVFCEKGVGVLCMGLVV